MAVLVDLPPASPASPTPKNMRMQSPERTNLLQGKRVKYQTPIHWSPPPFDAVEEYCDELCDSRRNVIPLGTMHGIEIQRNFCGRVTCWGDEHDDLGGTGLLKFVDDGKE